MTPILTIRAFLNIYHLKLKHTEINQLKLNLNIFIKKKFLSSKAPELIDLPERLIQYSIKFDSKFNFLSSLPLAPLSLSMFLFLSLSHTHTHAQTHPNQRYSRCRILIFMAEIQKQGLISRA